MAEISGVVKRLRRDTARQKELEAVQAEVQAEQVGHALEIHQAPDGDSILAATLEAAKIARERADAFHLHAGTTPGLFESHIREQIKGQLKEMKVSLERSIEQRDHADLYDLDPDRAAWDAAMFQAGVQVLEEMLEKGDDA